MLEGGPPSAPSGLSGVHCAWPGCWGCRCPFVIKQTTRLFGLGVVCHYGFIETDSSR